MDTIYKWLRAMPLRRGPRRLVGGVCGVVIPWGACDEAAEKATRRGSTVAIPPREDDPLLLEKFMTWGSDKLRN